MPADSPKRTVGRPKKTDVQRQVEATRDAHHAMRPERVPLQAAQKLVAPKREGYQRYWAIDKPGFLQKMEAAWWEYVVDERGLKITTPAGAGFTHYLMELPEDLYKEDIDRQQKLVSDTTDKAAQLQQGEYIPDGRQHVLTREVK